MFSVLGIDANANSVGNYTITFAVEAQVQYPQNVQLEIWNLPSSTDLMPASLSQIDSADAMFVEFHPKDIYELHAAIQQSKHRDTYKILFGCSEVEPHLDEEADDLGYQQNCHCSSRKSKQQML